MAISEVPAELRYRAHSDVTVYEKYARRAAKRHWQYWLQYMLANGPLFCLFGAAAYFFARMIAGAQPLDGIIPAALFGLVAAPLWALAQYESGMRLAILQQRGQSWDCELTAAHYQFTGSNGVTTSVPWSTMKIESEEAEYWEVSCGTYELLVYREPLRKAGLEEEFRRRVGQAPHSG